MPDEPRTNLNKTDARQGDTGHNVRYVLFGGLFLSAVAFVCVMAWWFGMMPKI